MTTEILAPGYLYEKTCTQAFTVPMYRFIGQRDNFFIINNLTNDKVELPFQVAYDLIADLTGYIEGLKKYNEQE